MNVAERFWAKVDKTEGGCWNWTGCKVSTGYGSFWNGSKVVMAHRWVMGEPKDLFVCHSCDNRACVNPDHLFLGTTDDNMQDMCDKKRQCYGPRHPLAKLTTAEVQYIKENPRGLSQRKLAKLFDTSQTTVWHIIHGKVRQIELEDK